MPDLDPAALAAAVKAVCIEHPLGCGADCRCFLAGEVRAALLAYLSADPRAAEIAALRAQVAGMREALEFYANPEIYKPHPHGPAFDRRDMSFKARAAIAAAKPGEGT